MDLADIKICKTLIINIVYFADSLNSYVVPARIEPSLLELYRVQPTFIE